jgi:hypothetical protein
MAFREYGSYDGIGLADLVRSKQISAGELLDEAIARTAKVDPQINAVVVKHYDYARRQIDKGLPEGPFAGVPFLLKDLELLAGTRRTSGASVYKDNVADNTSSRHASVTRPRYCVWLPNLSGSDPGKTNCRRFAHRLTKLSRIPKRVKDIGASGGFIACRPRSSRRPTP